MLFDRRNFVRLHLGWCLFVAALAAAFALIFAFVHRDSLHAPSGGSAIGLTYGLLAFCLFVFEAALAARRTRLFRTARWLGSAQLWLKAHLWLGLLTIPLVWMHSGFSFGSGLTWWLMAAYSLVIASGVALVAAQNILPRVLLESAPDEAVTAEIGSIGKLLADHAVRLAEISCRLPQGEFEPAGAGRRRDADTVVGFPRVVGIELPRFLHPERDLPEAVDFPLLPRLVRSEVAPYLASGRCAHRRLGTRERNERYFQDLTRRAPAALGDVIAALATLCERRRQLQAQQRLHLLLHVWVWVHLPATTALLVLLGGHIAAAWLYS